MDASPLTFPLVEGQEITLPSGVALYEAKQQDGEFAETPKVMRLRQHGRTPNATFSIRTGVRHDGSFRRGYDSYARVLFVPDGLKAGDVIVVQWADPNCACATKKAA